MRRIFLTLLSLFVAITVMAQYTVRSATSGVRIKSGNTVAAAAQGAKLSGADHVLIPEGGKIEILGANKKIYTSTQWGDVSVFNIVVEASKAAADRGGAVRGRLDFGRSTASKSTGTIFKEKGVTTRSMSVYDPEATGIEMDAATLGRFLAGKIISGDSIKCCKFPVKFAHTKNTDDYGLAFRIVNTLEYPIYFNVIKINDKKSDSLEISRLGQPEGTYVLLPQQAMSREHYPKVEPGERHILVMAPCRYDIDQMMDEMKKALSAGAATSDEELPVFAAEL